MESFERQQRRRQHCLGSWRLGLTLAFATCLVDTRPTYFPNTWTDWLAGMVDDVVPAGKGWRKGWENMLYRYFGLVEGTGGQTIKKGLVPTSRRFSVNYNLVRR